MKLQTITGLVVAMVVIALCGCDRHSTIVGVWQAGDDGKVTIEFLKDGSWRMSGATLTVGSNQVAVPLSGTYKMGDSNHIAMELGAFAGTNSFSLSYSLSGDDLELQTFNLDGQIKKYRRIRNQ